MAISGLNSIEGFWINDQKNGHVIESVNGFQFDGVYEYDKKNGAGKLLCPNGSFYEGQFENDKLNNLGVHIDHWGNHYEGFFQMGIKSGTGRLIFSDGKVYEGQFGNVSLEGRDKRTRDYQQSGRTIMHCSLGRRQNKNGFVSQSLLPIISRVSTLLSNVNQFDSIFKK
jgi:hypothetical protein